MSEGTEANFAENKSFLLLSPSEREEILMISSEASKKRDKTYQYLRQVSESKDIAMEKVVRNVAAVYNIVRAFLE